MTGTGVLSWTGAPMDVAAIEQQLLHLRAAAAGLPDTTDTGTIRTSLLNLVVYAPDQHHADDASRIIDGLARHHPSRAIVIVAHPSEDVSTIQAQCAAHCHTVPGLEQRVCCEEIRLNVSGRAAGHLHSIIIPLLIPDLPVYLWWTGPLPRGRHLFEELIDTADRFIVDSARFRHPTHGLLRVAGLIREAPGYAVGDLNWARMADWRDILFLHGSETAMRTYREAIATLEIAYAGDERTPVPAQAFLLVGWLAHLLGWDTRDPLQDSRLVLRRASTSIALRLFPRQSSLEPGSLLHVRLEDDHGASLTLTRPNDPLHLQLQVRTPDYVHHQLIRCGSPSPSDLLAAELDGPPRENTEYQRSLQHALPLLHALDVGHE